VLGVSVPLLPQFHPQFPQSPHNYFPPPCINAMVVDVPVALLRLFFPLFLHAKTSDDCLSPLRVLDPSKRISLEKTRWRRLEAGPQPPPSFLIAELLVPESTKSGLPLLDGFIQYSPILTLFPAIFLTTPPRGPGGIPLFVPWYLCRPRSRTLFSPQRLRASENLPDRP